MGPNDPGLLSADPDSNPGSGLDCYLGQQMIRVSKADLVPILAHVCCLCSCMAMTNLAHWTV